MSQPEQEHALVIDGKFSLEAIFVLGLILGTWHRYKKTGETEPLFEALQAYEDLARGKKLDWNKLKSI